MSRIGRRAIEVPSGATVTVSGQEVSVKGPKGALSTSFASDITVDVDDGKVLVARKSDHRRVKALHGLTRNLIANMVTGVTTGYQKGLEIRGVGYRADVQGRNLNLTLGFSHPVAYEIPEGVEIKVDRQTNIMISGIDKQLVGQVAANIRAYRSPDAYKGKGVRYAGEVIKLKAGKAGGK